MCNIHIYRFSLGMGPIIYKRIDKQGTEFALSAFPLGGYVAFHSDKVLKDDSELALISDVRFENEIVAIQRAGGFVVGLKRNPSKKKDKHPSETAIEKCIDLCDATIDNLLLTIPQQNEQIYLTIKHLDNIPDISLEE